MGAPKKNNPNLPEYATQLETLNNFIDFVLNINATESTQFKEDALKVIECLKFIKLNLEFIGYVVEHRNDSQLYKYNTDKSKGVIRDFSNTAMHFNAYSSKELVKTGLKNLVQQFESAIAAMQAIGELENFARQLQFDGDLGCVEARTAKALLFSVTRLSSASHHLDSLMEQCQFDPKSDALTMLRKAKVFFEPLIGQICIWENKTFTINEALIKRYLTEIFGVGLSSTPEELAEQSTSRSSEEALVGQRTQNENSLTDKLKSTFQTGSSRDCLKLIEKINSLELDEALLTQDFGFTLLHAVISNQPPDVCSAFINKLSAETIKKLFCEKLTHAEKIKHLKLVLKTQSLEVCIALLEKIDGGGNFKLSFIILFWENFKKTISSKEVLKGLRVLLAVVTMTGAGLIAILVGGPAIIGPCIIYASLTLYVAVVENLHEVIFYAVALPLAPLFVPIFVAYCLFVAPILAAIDTKKEVESLSPQSLLNDVLAFQSAKLLALFLHNLSPHQLKQLTLPLKSPQVQKHFPYFLLAHDLSVKSSDAFYSYCYSNQALRNGLIANKHLLLTRCIDYYFEGKCGSVHTKLVQLFEECLSRKQELSTKEQAFLQAIKQENISFPEMGANEIWQNGVKSWNHYRYLRQQNDPLMHVVLDHLLSADQLFQGTTKSFDENKNSELARDLQAFWEARECIQNNRGLAKVVQVNTWSLFIKQLESLRYRASLRAPIAGSSCKKFIHLTEEIVPYSGKRQEKNAYTHTKKTSTTLLAAQLSTPLFGEHDPSRPLVGFLFNREKCKVKAMLLRDLGTYRHEWIGSEGQVNQYKTQMQGINETNEELFIVKIKNSIQVNEVLAQWNKDALQAILIGRDTPGARCLAISRRDELRDKYSIDLPIIFYSFSQQFIQHYTLEDQANDKHALERNKEIILDIYKVCLEKLEENNWNLGFFSSDTRVKNKPVPQTVSFIKKLIEDACIEEQNAGSNKDNVWVEVKQKIQNRLNENCHEGVAWQFFKGRHDNTLAFYRDLKNQLSQTGSSIILRL